MIKELFEGPYAWLAKWGVITLLVASFGGFCWIKGDVHGTAKLTAYVGQQAVETSRIVLKRAEVIEKVVTKWRTKAAEAAKGEDKLKKDVAEYATLNLSYTLDANWRSLHDRAAETVDATVSGGAVLSGGAPTAAEAIETVTENYARAKRNAARLDALIEAWDKAAKVK